MNTPQQITQPSSFFDVSRSIAEKFIQTVVAVDDQISFGESENKVLDKVIEPHQNSSGLGEIEQIDNLEEDFDKLNSPYENDLNYQELSKCFAEKSILCSALKTFTGEGGKERTIEATVKIAKRADITILDWQMESEHADYGKIASASVKKLLDFDVENNGRLRLILIYTSEDISTVLRKLREQLDGFGATIKKTNEISFSGVNLQLCKIVVITKEVSIEELVDSSINEFTKITCGLLSNATLAAITEIRDKTHHHLYKFNSKLDSAYVSHVIGLISSPEMRESAHEVAFDYAVDLISEEIKSDLQTSGNLKRSLTSEIMGEWPVFKNPRNDNILSISVGDKDPVVFGNQRMEKILSVKTDEELKIILNEVPPFPKIGKKNSFESFRDSYIQFKWVGENNTDEHLELSALECLRRDPLSINDLNFESVLKQGTIIRKDDTYYVCIQPICDSVRLDGPTNFLFLKAEKVDDNNFSHVVRHREGYKCLRFKSTSRFVSLIEFTPRDKMIRATKNQDSEYVFHSTNEDCYEWCGEFKQAIYQEIVNSVTASIARVGFDSFEWLRLRNRKG